jgi:hypothetical protein
MPTRRISLIARFLAAGWVVFLCAPAGAANPSLMAHEQGIDDPEKHSEALQIATLDLRVDVVGTIADVTVTAKFSNPGDDDLEGRFTLDLPPGAVVTGYALDVDDTLIDGVLLDPLKARREYEERVRQKIDPGVAEVSRSHRFSTTIYPIASESTRTIRLRFSAPIDLEHGLSLPLMSEKPVGRFAIEVRDSAAASAPTLTFPEGVGVVEWRSAGSGFVASTSSAKKRLAGEFRIAPVALPDKGLITRHGNGTRMFQIAEAVESGTAPLNAGQRLRVYWDRSLSRRDDRLSEELSLLDKYLARAGAASIDLVTFNSSGARVRRAAPGEVGGILGDVLYRGATSFAVLEKVEVPDADVCLVFSDGVVTIDARRDFNPGCQVFAITSAPDADAGFLARLARPNKGAVFRLGRQSLADVLSGLRATRPRVIDARSEDGRALRIANVETDGGWIVVGQAPQAGGVTLRIAGAGGIVERSYSLVTARNEKFAGAGALWAADRVAMLGAEDNSREQLLSLSRRYSVASPSLSFIVLEQPSDYVEAGIAPPANYPKESMDFYRDQKAAHDRERLEAAEGRLAALIEQWDEQKEWWSTEFKPDLGKEADRAKHAEGAMAMAAPAPGAAPNREMVQAEDISSVLVTGMRASRNARQVDELSIGMELEEWDPGKPYIKALDAAVHADVDRVLAREESRNGMLPAFYFDVAEWLFRKKRGIEAVEMLLSALELPVANEETVSMVADRLLRYGRVDRAIWLYERTHEQTDYLPQPRRTLALALAKRAAGARPKAARADLRRAVKLLNEVVMTPWEGSYEGIEMVALMDVNNLLPKLVALGERDVPLDPRLRALLDVDIRVFIEWNTGATDMDLWVDEPGGERAIYSHPRTAIGGRLSNDMTLGFGPEEYLLRRALPGEYRISVNVYSSDSINPNGTTVVTAHLVRNFGRASEQEESMELELKPGDEGEKLVGRFTVR